LLQTIKKWFKSLFSKLALTKSLFSKPALTKSLPYVKLGDKDGNVVIRTQAQLDKRTHFKPGETYRLGEAIVTVHANKASMLAAIAATEAKRIEKEKRLRERAIDIMLMKPEELLQFQLDEWLAKRKVTESKITDILGKFNNRMFKKIKPPINKEERPPSGNIDTRKADLKLKFSEIVNKIEEKNKA